jgi:hypothetical protein
MAAFTVAALSFIGVPLFAGFITKWYLSLGALQADAWWFVLVMVSELAAQRGLLASRSSTWPTSGRPGAEFEVVRGPADAARAHPDLRGLRDLLERPPRCPACRSRLRRRPCTSSSECGADRDVDRPARRHVGGTAARGVPAAARALVVGSGSDVSPSAVRAPWCTRVRGHRCARAGSSRGSRGEGLEVYLLRYLTPHRLAAPARRRRRRALRGHRGGAVAAGARVLGGYMADGHAAALLRLLHACLGWTLGVAYAGNLLTFLIFYELFSI